MAMADIFFNFKYEGTLELVKSQNDFQKELINLIDKYCCKINPE
jgi:hypothetical protein